MNTQIEKQVEEFKKSLIELDAKYRWHLPYGIICDEVEKALLTTQKQERERYQETNIQALVKEMEEDIEEYGALHHEYCLCNMEDPDECDCEEMKALKGFGREWMGKVNQMWVAHLMAHRKYCTPDGNKNLTRIKKALTTINTNK